MIEPSVSEIWKDSLRKTREVKKGRFNGMRGRKSKEKKKEEGKNKTECVNVSWRASDGAGVVFSLASSGPDGKGSSSSSPRCIWQQLLFTAGYCTSLSVSSLSR